MKSIIKEINENLREGFLDKLSGCIDKDNYVLFKKHDTRFLMPIYKIFNLNMSYGEYKEFLIDKTGKNLDSFMIFKILDKRYPLDKLNKELILLKLTNVGLFDCIKEIIDLSDLHILEANDK